MTPRRCFVVTPGETDRRKPRSVSPGFMPGKPQSRGGTELNTGNMYLEADKPERKSLPAKKELFNN